MKFPSDSANTKETCNMTNKKQQKSKKRKSGGDQESTKAERRETLQLQNREHEDNNQCNTMDEDDIKSESTIPKKKPKIRSEIQQESAASKASKPSKRQLKREKAAKRENDMREASKAEAKKRALNYISKWKHARNEWKFEKLRQVWLIDNLLNDTAVPDDIFPTVVEYFEGCKGMARKELLQKAMDIVKKAEEITTQEKEETEEDEGDNNTQIIESVAYKRARQLLQALPTEC